MIVSDQYAFVFIHIPKCAGTSIREVLVKFHDNDPCFISEVASHPIHGRVDYKHLPLALLETIAPEQFAKLASHTSFAIVRNPRQRFQSAMAQRAKMYLGQELAQMESGRIAEEIDRVIAHLDSVSLVNSAEFIHFSRQSDFVIHGGEQIVGNVFPVERLDLLAEALARRVGEPLQVGHANRTTVFRHPQLRKVARVGSDLSKWLMPTALNRSLRSSARRMLMKPGEYVYLPQFDRPKVEDFIHSYYALDFALHEAARKRSGLSGS